MPRLFHALAAPLVVGAVALVPSASGQPRAVYDGPTSAPTIRSILGPFAAETSPTEVLVLATPHLAELPGGVRPEALQPLLRLLSRFRPTAICVEHLPGRDIRAMDALGGTYRQVAEMFASADLRLGRRMGRLTRRSPEASFARAEPLLSGGAPLDAPRRRRLVADLAAALELPSALLQWSYLPEESRRPGPDLPKDVTELLRKRLRSTNEIESLAIPLARGAGLQRLFSVDSQWDGARILREPEPMLEEAFGHPLHEAARALGPQEEQRRLTEEGMRSGNLLPLYLFINGPDFAARDVLAQWSPWLRTRLSSGVDRLRYGNWEARNARIVAHVADASVSTQPGRVLLVIGAAHRPFVEEQLRTLVGLRVLSLDALAAAER